jgi:hypothetical protein
MKISPSLTSINALVAGVRFAGGPAKRFGVLLNEPDCVTISWLRGISAVAGESASCMVNESDETGALITILSDVVFKYEFATLGTMNVSAATIGALIDISELARETSP